MTLPVVLRKSARAELDEAFDWYEAQGAGLGVRFATWVQDTFDRIAFSPESYPVVTDDIRRAIVRRYPYAIYFRIRLQQIAILTVVHTSQDPRVWQRRVT